MENIRIKLYFKFNLMHEKAIWVGALLTLFTGFTYIIPYYYEKKEKMNAKIKKTENQGDIDIPFVENKRIDEERKKQQESDEAIKKVYEAKELEDFKLLSINEQRLRGLEIFNQEQKDRRERIGTIHSNLSKYALSIAFPHGTGTRWRLL